MNNIWTDEELMFTLYLYLERKNGKILERRDFEHHVDMLNEFSQKNRTCAAMKMRLENFRYLDVGEGLSHAGRALEIWNKYNSDIKKLKEVYEIVMTPFSVRQEKLIKMGSKKGFLTYNEIVELLKGLKPSEEDIASLYSAINENEIILISEEDNIEDDLKNEFENHLIDKGYNLGKDDKEVYLNLFRALFELTNKKLPYKDIIERYDEISDEMKLLPKDDRIKIPFYKLDKIFNSLLTKEEKEYFLFAIWYGECVTISLEIEGENVLKNGNTKLTSIESIIKLKDSYYKDSKFYKMFHFEEDNELFKIGKFGYSKKNPVQSTNINNTKIYLESLKTSKGKKVNYKRLGSVFLKEIDKSIDEYELYKQSFFGRNVPIGIIFINSYSNYNSTEIPKGLII